MDIAFLGSLRACNYDNETKSLGVCVLFGLEQDIISQDAHNAFILLWTLPDHL